MTYALPLDAVEDVEAPTLDGVDSGAVAIEDDGFPFEEFCDVAELESWRKEVNRPLYYIHKWWARRLGTVFRAMVVGTFSPACSDVKDSFYRPVRFPQAVVFDPFMGSGTTIGEALKLGCRAIGRDINPVAHFAVRNALARHSREEVIREFKAIEDDVAGQIQHFYQARLPEGGMARTLYYFWVKVIDCPNCSAPVDLFGSYLFARHAYPKRNPVAHAVCPSCGAIAKTRYDAATVTCSSCGHSYDPKTGPANGTRATCGTCAHVFPIAKAVRESGHLPKHRLYAKLVLTDREEKQYLPIDEFDRELYCRTKETLRESGKDFLVGELAPGYNTDQAINYGYLHWRDMFNDRQLLCLKLLADRIRSVKDERLRELFACLFSGVLEFNNMFASYKGEGTGAVRHMFAHHILKPERTPLEANPWGTPKSSGSFSTLFKTRILRALEYCDDPFEISVDRQNGRLKGRKVFGLSEPLGCRIASDFDSFKAGDRVYLSCGDSGRTDLASESVDAVITDPPFFDNVHYSQLADFFHAWQRYMLTQPESCVQTTRSDREVQHTDADTFASRLGGVWKECERVLKPNGLLVFTYHHSRPEGWRSVLEAIASAGFALVAAHPIKAEMSVAMPKNQANEPIDLDIIMVCRRISETAVSVKTPQCAWKQALEVAGAQVGRLRKVGRNLSRNDIRVVIMAQLVRFLSLHVGHEDAMSFLEGCRGDVDQVIGEVVADSAKNVDNKTPSRRGAF